MWFGNDIAILRMASLSMEYDLGGNGRRRRSGGRQVDAARPTSVMLAAFCALALSGCSGKPERPAPPTFPVSGVVKAAKGPLPVGGCVEFKPYENENELTATGVIKADGKFSLSIPYVDRVIPGATAGPHRAYIVMPLGANREGGGYVPIEEEFVVEPRRNEFTITMPEA